LSVLIFYFFDFEEMNEGLSRVVFPSKKEVK
jgi:preprotein translocase subunit SecE